MTLGFCQYEIGENNRVAWNIVSTDIQHPGDIIQCSQNMHFGTVLFHLFAYFCKTLRSGFTGIFCIKDPHGFCGKCRAVRPDLTDQVASIGKKTLRKCFLQCFAEHFIDNAAVKTNGHALFCICRQVFLYRRNAFLAHFH